MQMSWFVPPRTDEAEYIDLPDTPWEDVLMGMRDVQRINSLLLVYPVLATTFLRLAAWPLERPLRVLDVATGLADIPRALVDLARVLGRRVEVVGLDLNPRILAMAGEATRGYPEIQLVEGDALALPFGDGSFDWAFCHFALHHLPPGGHARFLHEMDRVIRPGGGILLGDLERSHLNLALARPFLGLFTSRMARHDGVVSILKAHSGDELRELLRASGLHYLQRQWPAPAAQFVVAGVKPG